MARVKAKAPVPAWVQRATQLDLPLAVLKTVCCACGVVLQDGPPEPVSHGYCVPCVNVLRAQAGLPLKQEDV